MNPYIDAHIHTIGDPHAVGGVIECVYPPETHGMKRGSSSHDNG